MPSNVENLVTQEGVELGRHLFYDVNLSKSKTISCASCHRQEAAFSDAPNQFSKGSNNLIQKRNTPPLFNLAWRKSYFWDGRSPSIEEQVLHPVRGHDEMDLNWTEAISRVKASEKYRKMFHSAFNGVIDSNTISKAIAQFERTLISHNSKYDKVIRGEAYFTEEERKGFILMNDQTKGDCLHCHPSDGSVIMTTSDFSNNGLEDAKSMNDFSDLGRGGITGSDKDIGKFKIPSLRNVALTAPYMHDGRFNTLEEVLDFYADDLHASPNYDARFSESIHRGGVRLNEEERKQVIAFLYTLTDSVLISEKKHSNPFLDQPIDNQQ